ncbi:hypothetical protein J6590_081826 [Homalodisca vitripennis]|nr:hypothetical protein J6590_081826 [Homalodisca vitripennis]
MNENRHVQLILFKKYFLGCRKRCKHNKFVLLEQSYAARSDNKAITETDDNFAQDTNSKQDNIITRNVPPKISTTLHVIFTLRPILPITEAKYFTKILNETLSLANSVKGSARVNANAESSASGTSLIVPEHPSHPRMVSRLIELLRLSGYTKQISTQDCRRTCNT